MISQIKKHILLTRFLGSPYLRKISFKTLFNIYRMMLNERIQYFNGKIYSNSYLPPFPSVAFDRFLINLKKMESGIYAPQALIISATDRCPNNCWYCFNKKNKSQSDLALEKIIKVIKFFQAKGIFGVYIVGGEPLLRKDICEIVKAGAGKCSVHLDTSGVDLTLGKARKLKEAGLETLKVSLEYYERATVEKITGLKGSFDSAVEAIKIGKEVGFYVCSVLVMTKKMLYDRKEQEKYLDFVKSLRVNEVMVYEPKPSGNLYNADESIIFNEQDREQLCQLHLRINKDKKYNGLKFFSLNYFESPRLFGCNAGLTQFYLTAGGDLTPCPLSSLSLGNIDDEELDVIYERFKRIFKQPMRICTSIYCQEFVKKAFQGTLPISKDVSEKILANLDFNELPDLYKRILKK